MIRNHRFLLLVLMTMKVFICECCNPNCICEEKDGDVFVTCMGHNLYTVPQTLPQYTTKLYFSGTAIRHVYKTDLSRYRNVTELFFRDTASDACELEYLAPGVFDGFNSLIALGIIGCGRLVSISSGVFREFASLETLHIYRSGLQEVPDFSQFRTLNPSTSGFMEEIDLHNNMIQDVRTGAFSGVKVDILKLDQNKISTIQSKTFQNATILNLHLNQNFDLTTMENGAFEEADLSASLDLSDTRITSLPTIGLNKIKTLILKNTPSLIHFPSVLELPKIEIAKLYYPHHCCAFANPEKQDPVAWKLKKAQEQINKDCRKLHNTSLESIDRPKRQAVFKHGPLDLNGSFIDHFADGNGFGRVINATNRPLTNHDPTFREAVEVEKIQNTSCGDLYIQQTNITCTPVPDAFNPCEDVMGYVWLRVTIWFVLLAALLGNSLVLLVLITSRSKFGVPKFLMCNLAFADFTMGVYLIFIASIDAHTLGEYFNYAVQWQNGGGCQAAGFLSVFSSELSVFTLTILTLERWYAISHAIHLNKRLKFRHSVVLMIFGFIYATALATLPLVGVSGYGNVSICLPMKAKNNIDLGYVVSLLLMNGLMFLAICFCYLSMYWKVKGSANSVRNNDAKIAKRMAILVFTNFACWAPIAFFGLTASAGMPLIDITNSKILFVFFYPLNSCANPFLYAILTKQFRKDVFILLGKYGLCVEKANRYRGTHTSRTMSQSRGHKDMLHGVHRRTESLFSRLSSLQEGTNGSRGPVSTPPKVHPSSDKLKKYSLLEKSHVETHENFNKGDETRKAEDHGKPQKPDRHTYEHPPYIRSVSDYIGYNNQRMDLSTKRYLRTRNSTETTSTYISSGTDSVTDVLSDTFNTNEDVWKLRDQDTTVDNDEENFKLRPFTCLIYPENDELRISHKGCFSLTNGGDVDEDEPFLPRYIRDDIINLNSFKFDSNNDNQSRRSPTKCNSNSDNQSRKSPTKNNSNSRLKFPKDPSLISLDENVESCFLQTEPADFELSTSQSAELELLFNDTTSKIDKHSNSWF